MIIQTRSKTRSLIYGNAAVKKHLICLVFANQMLKCYCTFSSHSSIQNKRAQPTLLSNSLLSFAHINEINRK